MAIMITGGTGFLGGYLARHLVREKGEKGVVLFDRYLDLARIAEVRDEVTLVRGDVTEPQELCEAIARHDVDRIIHLAFLPGNADPAKIPPYIRVQTMGTTNVFDAARIAGIKRVCNASSMAAYGPVPRDRPVTEDDPLYPRGTYGVCKAWSEGIAQFYNEMHGMEIISLRICASLGVGRLGRASLASGLMPPDETPHYMANPELAAMGQPVVMPPDEEVMDFIYAADGAEVWWLALNAVQPKHFVFNMRSEQRPVGDMTRILRRLLPDARIDVSGAPPRKGVLMDNTRLVEELGFRPRYTLETALEDYVNHARHREGLPLVSL